MVKILNIKRLWEYAQSGQDLIKGVVNGKKIKC
jgi:hypothetical protein